MAEPKLTYGLDENGTLIHVDDADHGKDCNCVCPKCGAQLVAKQGGKNQWHFSHYKAEDCQGGRMTALHMLAQQIIQEEKKIRKPWFKDYYEDRSKEIYFESVLLEQRFKTTEINRRPDCVGIIKNGDKQYEVWIEVKVKHAIDDDKRNDIIRLDAICMEIDISGLLTERYTENSVRKALFDVYDNKEWINYPALFRKNAIAKQKKEEEERVKREQEEEKIRLEEERRQKQLQEEKERLQNIVEVWMKGGSEEAAKVVINEITSNPYGEKNPYILKNILVSHDNYIELIENSPKNKIALSVFYTVLKYYNKQISKHLHLDDLNKALSGFRYKKSISEEEKILLEELISLRVAFKLRYEHNYYKRIHNVQFLYDLLQYYYTDELFRNKCLKALSLEYRNVVGSNAKNFTELTKEIAEKDCDIIPIYLRILDFVHYEQDRYPKHNIPEINDAEIVKIRKFAQENKKLITNTNCRDILIVAYTYIWGKEIHLKTSRENLLIGDKDESIFYRKSGNSDLDYIEKLCLDIADKFEPIPED